MNSSRPIRDGIVIACLTAVCLVCFGACQYEVPITSSPSRKVDERLLGNWTSADGKEKMKIRRLDESTYIVYSDGDLFRAYHSDIDGTALVSVQDLNSNDRKFAYIDWKLSDDGKTLSLRNVNDKVMPKTTRDSATAVALLKQNTRNPELFGEEISFNKQ